MTVIAMTRELGTLGQEVAAHVAGELGLEVVHDELIESHLAERLQLDEAAVRRLLTGQASLWERWKVDVRRVSQFTAAEVLHRAQKGNVIIRGWGAAQLLRDVAHVICVRVCAPMPFRIAEMKRRLALEDDAAAHREVERSDDAHERTVRVIHDADWRDATGYSLVLNTGRIGIDTASELLLHLARERQNAETPESRQLLQDKLVLARVREALMARGGHGLEVRVENGAVTVTGALVADESIERLLDVVRGVEGVRSVESDMHVLPINYGA